MKYFGTDGIRGIPFNFPFEPDFIRKIGFSIAKRLKNQNKTVFIARDTRESGKKITQYLVDGISYSGLNVFDLGVITTPSLAYLLSKNKVSFGVMVSASHNPPEFNGIKVLTATGEKISKELEKDIEKIIDSTGNLEFKKYKTQKKDIIKDYIDYAVKNFDGKLKGLDIVIDCSNGSAYKIAPLIFKKLKVNLEIIGNKPDGKNINVGCGALNVKKMRSMVVKSKAFCGISYDGDSDRCIFSDENGNIIDGDDMIAALCYYYKQNNLLENNTVVLTHMSNFGLLRFLEENKIKVISVDIGDRNVSHMMIKSGSILGGEPSGHIIIKRYLPTGDGILTSLEFLSCLTKMNMNASDVKKMWERLPSYLGAYRIDKKLNIKKLDDFMSFIKKTEKEIKGRIFVRYSGTEPVLRVLVEADMPEKKLKEFSDKVFKRYCDITKKIAVK
ncbi:MAG: phosphoglucosamine mutase [Elusimicrobiota bacterium]